MQSPETATQLRKYFIAGDELNFAAVDLTYASLNLDAPRFLYVRVTGSVKGLDQGECQFRPLTFRQLRRFLLQLSQGIRHGHLYSSSVCPLYVCNPTGPSSTLT